MTPEPLDADAKTPARRRPPIRPLAVVAPIDREQLPRLAAFKDAHPEVIAGGSGFGTWQALLPQPAGEIAITRHTLRELMDVLEEIYPPDPGG